MFEVRKNKSTKRAFTLIELIVVIAVIGVLVLLAAPKFLGYVEQARTAQIVNDIKVHENEVKIGLLKNNELTESWLRVDRSELEQSIGDRTLFSKVGLVEDASELESAYSKIPKGFTNSKLKGDFLLAEGGEVYYSQQTLDKSEPVETKTAAFNFDEAVGADQEHVITIEDLNNVRSIQTDNGVAEVVSVDGDKVTVRINNGELVRKEQTGGELIPEDTKYVEFETDGYEEGIRIANNVERRNGVKFKYFSEDEPLQESSSGDVDLITGEDGYLADEDNPLSREYIGADYRMVTQKLKSGEAMKWYTFDKGDWTPGCGSYALPGFSQQRYVDQNTEDGYFTPRLGSYILGDIITSGRYISDIDGDTVDERDLLLNVEEGTCARVFKHETSYEWDIMAVKGGFENARWKYSGEVTKPAQDTRTYDEYYKYSVTVEYE